MFPAIIVVGKYIYQNKDNKNKNYYRCYPHKSTEKTYLVPYNIKPNFSKISMNYYILIKYDDTDGDIIYCTLIETIGQVSDLNAFDRYQLHCANLVSKVKRLPLDTIKNRELFALTDNDLINNLSRNIYTLDSIDTVDMDDAFSITDSMLSIYIINVAYYLKTIPNLMEYIETMISSTIYIEQRIPMLNSAISNKLTLIKDEPRVVITLDIDLITGEYLLYNSVIKVSENLRYDVSNDIVDHLVHVTRMDDSHKAIEYLMTTMSKYMANINADFIYMATGDKIDNDYVDYMIYKSYYTLNKEINLLFKSYYIHITSPIRRLVDLLNQLIFEKYEVNICQEMINKINDSQKSIKKIQTKSRLLRLFKDVPDAEYEGVVIGDTIYIPSINLFYKSTEDMGGCTRFKIYLFENKNTYARKVKIGKLFVI
jgi:hypothetical protein